MRPGAERGHGQPSGDMVDGVRRAEDDDASPLAQLTLRWRLPRESDGLSGEGLECGPFPSLAVELDDLSACLLDQDEPSRQVPDPQSAEDDVVEHARGGQRGLVAGAADAAHVAQPSPQAIAVTEHAEEVRGPRGHPSLGLGPSVQPQRLVAVVCAASGAGVEHTALRPVDIGEEHGAGDGTPALEHTQKHREDREAVEEVRGAVERVDHPHDLRGLVLAFRLLGEDAVGRESPRDLPPEVLVGGPIGVRDRTPVVGDFVVDVEGAREVAQQDGARRADELRGRGLDLSQLRVVQHVA